MTARGLTIARVLGVWGLALWLGGLPTYGGLVLPRLHEVFDVPTAALVTRQVTVSLNLVGVVVVVGWWALLGLDRRPGGRRTRRLRVILLGVSTAILGAQYVLHGRLGALIDAGREYTAAFYPLHRAYLILSTAQWLANLAVLGLSVVLWSTAEPGREVADGTPESRDRPR